MGRTPEGAVQQRLRMKIASGARYRATARLIAMFPELYDALYREEAEKVGIVPNGRRTLGKVS